MKVLLVLALVLVSGMVFAAEWNVADINGDGFVNAKDVVILGTAFGSAEGDENWNAAADLKADGVINAMDAVVMGTEFGKVK